MSTRPRFLLAGVAGLLLSFLLAILFSVSVPLFPTLAILGEQQLGTVLAARLFLLALGLIAVLEVPLVLYVLIRAARRGVPGWALNLLHLSYIVFPAIYGGVGTFLTGERWWLWVMMLLSLLRFVSSAFAIDPPQMAARHARRAPTGE